MCSLEYKRLVTSIDVHSYLCVQSAIRMKSKDLLVLHEIPSGNIAIWERIADEIRRRIDSGLWAAGQQMMAEADLATELGVARGTLRRAVKDLCESGHLVQRHGRGTYVAKRIETPMVNRLESLGERMIRAGLHFATSEISRELLEDGGDVGFEGVPVLIIRRTRSIDGAAIAVLDNALPLDLFPGIETKDLVSRPLYSVLEEDYNAELVRAERTFRAIAADAELAELLDVPLGYPVLHFQQVSWGPAGLILDVSETWVRSDRHQPTVSMWRNV